MAADSHRGSKLLSSGPQGAGCWDPDDLVRRLCLALDIAERSVEYLAVEGFHDEQEPEKSVDPEKPIAETAMLLYVASTATWHAEVKERVDRLACILAPYARSERMALNIAFNPSVCLQLAMPHILLSRLGLPDPQFDQLLQLSIDSSARRGHECTPYRELELMWIEAVWRGETPGPEFDRMASASVLNCPLDLLYGHRDDAYAHTHVFMYFTDFGYKPRALPRPRTQILEESTGVLAGALNEQDYDLAAEALMAWPQTGAPWSPTAAFGFRVLATLEDQIGFLPGGTTRAGRFHELGGEQRTRYAMATSYHTAYVMGLLCALALRPGSAPPVRIGDSSQPSAIVGELIALIDETSAHWLIEFRGLEPFEQAALAPLLLDLALLQKNQKHDYAAINDLLRFAILNDLADSPMCAQAAELLHRLSSSAEIRQTNVLH